MEQVMIKIEKFVINAHNVTHLAKAGDTVKVHFTSGEHIFVKGTLEEVQKTMEMHGDTWI